MLLLGHPCGHPIPKMIHITNKIDKYISRASSFEIVVIEYMKGKSS